MSLTPQQVLAAARLKATRKMPYLSMAIWNLIPKPVPGLGQAMVVTNKLVMLYDPDVIVAQGIDTTMVGLLHEVSHPLRQHFDRGQQVPLLHQGHPDEMKEMAKLWNTAADAEINDDLKQAGLPLLPTDPLPSQFGEKDGRTAEEYFRVLYERHQQKKPNPQPQMGEDGCGSSSGNRHPSEPDDNDPNAQGRSPADCQRIRQQVAEEVQRHVAQHGRGSVPGGWSVWADEQLAPPKVRWQDRCRRVTRNGIEMVRGMTDYTYTKPSRRQSAFGYGPGKPLLPSMNTPQVNILFVGDTSGSMGTDELTLVVTEVVAVARGAGLRLDFMTCDADVHATKRVRGLKDVIDCMKGGGGTDFRPAFEMAKKMRPRPNLIICGTDGDGPAPDEAPPGCKVIWLLVGNHARVPYDARGKNVTYGEQIWITSEELADK